MIIRPIIHTAHPNAWKDFMLACGAVPIVEGDSWSVYGLGRGRLGVELADHEPPGSVSLSLESERLDKVGSPYVRVAQPGDHPDLTVLGYDLPELLIHNLEYEPVRGGKLSATPLLLTTKVNDNIPVFESLGMEVRMISDSENYAEVEGDGTIALHVRDENEAPRIDLSFGHPDLDELAEHVRVAGFNPYIVTEDYGRSLRVPVGDEQAWVNETPADHEDHVATTM